MSGSISTQSGGAITSVGKKTGKDLQTRTYFPYVSQLTLA